jgi:hypothetical protein
MKVLINEEETVKDAARQAIAIIEKDRQQYGSDKAVGNSNVVSQTAPQSQSGDVDILDLATQQDSSPLTSGVPGLAPQSDPSHDDLDLGDLVKTLDKLVRDAEEWGNQHGYPSRNEYPQYGQIRAIGELLYQRGGSDLMHKAYYKMIYVLEDSWWHMIGDWRS